MDQGQAVGALMNHFTKWEDGQYSLFSAAQHFETEQLHKDYLSDLGVIREADLNWRATRLLLQHNHDEQVFHHIEQAYQLNPQSIHMWANKGVYYLSQTPPQIEQARAAKSRFDECLQDGELVKAAKIQFAYWSYGWGAYFMHNMNPEITNRSLEIMRNEVPDTNENPEHHFMYMKLLQMQVRNKPEYERLSALEGEVWLRDLISRMIDQMIILARQQDPQYELEIWNLLLDTQHPKYGLDQLDIEKQRLMRISSVINNFHRQDPANHHNYDMKGCIQKLLAIRDDPDTQVEIHPQFYYIIGHFYRHIANTQTKKLNEKREILQQALDIIEPELMNDTSEGRILGLRVASETNMYMWAVQYYKNNPEQARREYLHYSCNGNVAGRNAKNYSILRFLAYDYYARLRNPNADGNYLQNAYEQLDEIIRNGSCRIIAPTRYLLGHPHDVIEAGIGQNAIKEHDRVKSAYHHGLFLEARGNYTGAITRYEEAVTIQTIYSTNSGDTYNPHRAVLGIRRCKNSLRDRGDNNNDGDDDDGGGGEGGDGRGVGVPRVANLRMNREPNLGGGLLKSWRRNNP